MKILIIRYMSYIIPFLLVWSFIVPTTTFSDPIQVDNDLIHIAAELGNVDQVRKLLVSNPALINAVGNRRGWRPINWSENIEIANLLIENGAILNPEPEKGPDKPDSIWSPLQAAALNGKVKIVEFFLLKGALVDWKGINHRTALSFASENGNLKIVVLLLLYGADVNLGDEMNTTPLHYATLNNHKNIVEFLLQHDANINVQMSGEVGSLTPLAIAKHYNHNEIKGLLLSKGAKDN